MKLEYTPNKQKIIETILWFLHRSQRTDLHSILKEIFFSDKIHLTKYGRPVTGDYFIKMSYGPVPSYAYDLLKVDRLSEYVRKQRYTADILEDAIRAFDTKDQLCIKPLREPDLCYFSGTDIECMEQALAECNGKSFDDLVMITHADPAWQKAQLDQRMDFEDFIENRQDKEEYLEYLRESSIWLSL
jgi:uncharacterized phage-associated protein